MSKCAVILVLAVGASVATAANTEDFEAGTVGQMVSDLAGWSRWGGGDDPSTTVQLDPAAGANKVMRQMNGGDVLWDAHGTFGPSSGTGDDFNTGWMHYQVDVYIAGNTIGDTDYSFEGRGSTKVSLWHKILTIRSDGDGTGAVQLDSTGWQDCEADVWCHLDLLVDIDGATYQASWTYTPAGGGAAVVLTGSDTVTDGMPNNADAFATNDIWQNTSHTVYYDNLSVDPIPEPATLGLFAAGAWLVLRRRRQA
jgi:hypothetical protein